jgi:hypothetical protein
MQERDPLREVYALMDASSAAFEAKDVTGWQSDAHPLMNSFQGDRFMNQADFDEGGTAFMLEVSDAWEPVWRDGAVEGDAVCVWGEWEWRYRAGDEPRADRYACSWYWVRVNDSWKSMFAHYTPITA